MANAIGKLVHQVNRVCAPTKANGRTVLCTVKVNLIGQMVVCMSVNT
jgi:hypothetical protein